MVKSNGHPEIQVILLNKDIEQEEVERNLSKEDCDYQVVDKEKQWFLGEIGKCVAMKYTLWSERKQKFKILVFL